MHLKRPTILNKFSQISKPTNFKKTNFVFLASKRPNLATLVCVHASMCVCVCVYVLTYLLWRWGGGKEEGGWWVSRVTLLVCRLQKLSIMALISRYIYILVIYIDTQAHTLQPYPLTHHTWDRPTFLIVTH